MKKSFNQDIQEINKNIKEAELLLKESMGFYEEDEMDYNEEESMKSEIKPDMKDDKILSQSENIESYVDHIRKYALNGLSALCENPDSEEYQMLKKIFQMCDKKPEKKENMMESHRLFGVLKENKKVIFETNIYNSKDFNTLKSTLINESIKNGYNPNSIRLVSEKKLIK